MKTLIALLISCITLSAATTYPVLTDSTNRLFPGGVTNVFFLNSNVVTTGTMRATGVLTLTNASNVFAGDGSGLTGAGIATTGGSATNFQIYSSGTTNQPLRVWLGTQTNSNPVEISGVFNNASVGFSAFKVNVTNTASDAASTIFDSQLGGSSQLAVRRDGIILIGGGSGTLQGSAGQLFISTPNAVLPYGANIVMGASLFRYDGDLGIGPVGPSSRVGLAFRDTAGIFWSSGSSYSGTDTALGRSSAGVVEVHGGTSGVFRDLMARSLYATNLYATNLVINGGATVTKILSATATLNFDLTALTVEDLTITVTGAADGDVVTLGVPNGSITTSVQYSAWVSAADTVTVRARTSATGENPASGVFRATVIKH